MKTEKIDLNCNLIVALPPNIVASNFAKERVKYDHTYLDLCDICGYQINELSDSLHIIHFFSKTNPVNLCANAEMVDSLLQKSENLEKCKEEKRILIQGKLSDDEIKTALSLVTNAEEISYEDAKRFDRELHQ